MDFNQKFRWRISERFYSNLKLREFVKYAVVQLNSHQDKQTSYSELLAPCHRHNHICANLWKKSSKEAKQLCKVLRDINDKLSDTTTQEIAPEEVIQLEIKHENKPLRCYGYVLGEGDNQYFYLVHIDTEHKIYEE